MGFMEERLFSRHTNVKFSLMKYQIYKEDGVPGYQQSSSSSSSGTKISPAVLFIIVILAVLFFISGLLHLLFRFLSKHNSSSNSHRSNRFPDGSPSDALQRQLQQLFHLHDSGLDQTFIDALPVFMYKVVVGANEPFDCAVCLCEFSENDKLRLLPTCSHAFHINCIDTWLLSNSTCPLCRNTLFDPGFSMDNPVFDFDYPREADETGISAGLKTIETEQTQVEKGGFSVRLGKFRKLSEGESETGGETSSSNLDARRCYSMGSYEYVVGATNLRVPLIHLRDLQDAEFVKNVERIQDHMLDEVIEGKKINIGAKTDSFSVSKIWLWSKKRKFASSSDNQMHNPSSVDMELPRMGRFQGTTMHAVDGGNGGGRRRLFRRIAGLSSPNRIGDVKALGRCCVVSRRFHSLVPQVENVVVRVDCVISDDDSSAFGSSDKSHGPISSFFRIVFGGIVKPIQEEDVLP